MTDYLPLLSRAVAYFFADPTRSLGAPVSHAYVKENVLQFEFCDRRPNRACHLAALMVFRDAFFNATQHLFQVERL